MGKYRAVLTLAIAIMFLSCSSSTGPEDQVIKVGFGKRDITPPIGSLIVGNIGRDPFSSSINDPLWVKALYLESEEQSALLISTDLSYAPFPNELRSTISARSGIPESAIIICGSHNHKGPSVHSSLPWAGQQSYVQALKIKVVEAAEEAQSAATRSTLGYAEAKRSDLSKNRRSVIQNGSVFINPRLPDIRVKPDGPIDPQIQAVLVQDLSSDSRVIIVGFACHLTSFRDAFNATTADFPYWIEKEIQRTLGKDVEVMYFNGAFADLNPMSESAPGLDRAQWIGSEIGKDVVKALENGIEPIAGPIYLANTHVSLPMMSLGKDRLQWAESVLQAPGNYKHALVWMAEFVVQYFQTNMTWWPDEVTVEVPLVAIGDLAFYGISGELYTWYGLQLKAHSRFRYPFILGAANEVPVGNYISDSAYFGKDWNTESLNFETRPFGKTGDAGEILVQAALGL